MWWLHVAIELYLELRSFIINHKDILYALTILIIIKAVTLLIW